MGIGKQYLALLQERCVNSIYPELRARLKFFNAEPENIKIRALLAQGDPRVRTDFRRYADGEFPAYFDPRSPSYSVNQHEGYFICEGIAPQKIADTERFIENTCFNAYCAINTILVVGQPQQGQAKFYDYFSAAGRYGQYSIDVTRQEMLSTGIKRVVLQVSKSYGDTITSKTIDLYQVINMPDHQTADLNADDIAALYKICTTIEPEHLVVHCAGGLGRSPTILFSFILFKKFSHIFTKPNQDVVAAIATELTSFRQARPAAVQQLAQLEQAIALAVQYKAIEWQLQPELVANDTQDVANICLLGTFDTKAQDYAYVRRGIIASGCNVYTINLGFPTTEKIFPIITMMQNKLHPDTTNAYPASQQKANHRDILRVVAHRSVSAPSAHKHIEPKSAPAHSEVEKPLLNIELGSPTSPGVLATASPASLATASPSMGELVFSVRHLPPLVLNSPLCYRPSSAAAIVSPAPVTVGATTQDWTTTAVAKGVA